MSYFKKHGVFIYFPEKQIDPNFRHYGAVALAEGLKELGYAVYSNVADSRFSQREVGQFKEGLMVFSVTEDVYSEQLMAAINDFRPGVKVILSMSDTSSTMMTPQSTPAFFSHENRFLEVPGRRLPWAFGLSRERISACGGSVQFGERKKVILRNFRPSGNQSIRESLDFALVPNLEKHFVIDREINAGDHYARLQSCLGCLAYGGAYKADLKHNPYLLNLPASASAKHWFGQVRFKQDPVILRWDSWRWWESLASGCLTFHLDFEKYGMLLPVAPEPWIHYVPIDLSDPLGVVTRLMENDARWEQIAANGRDWALKHYTPRPTAERFLKTVEEQR
ncbi:hypothetical protein CMV30_18555 [Nibricoccus aquaticus]|uniref:Glycosyltransferase family 1 protein n=1 Tax=Nibricoccus aquaticus TaxID=2576891 RepID=A0A290QC08_9BACT|nr:glycosyltransferase [Nibricoccus aquaticus]ATC65787.1 hypothetical protein CMV30_18555 [Nibricoccus aquaticus]